MTMVDILENVTFGGENVPPGSSQLQLEISFLTLFEAEGLKPGQVFPAKFWIDSPQGPITPLNVEVNFIDGKRGLTIIQSQLLPYVGPGKYVFSLNCEGVLATWPITVHLSE